MRSIAFIIIIVGGIVFSIFSQNRADGKSATPKECLEMVQADSSIVVLDVRTAEEFRSESGHLEGALLIPLQELERRVGELESFKEKTIIAYCRSGNRSGVAAKMLTPLGYTVINMSGGIIEWNRMKLPVVHEP